MKSSQTINFMPEAISVEVYVERPNPDNDLGGLCECFVSRADGARTVAALHMHRYFELIYCLSGRYELRAERRVFPLQRGGAALIHPMEPHQTRSLDAGENRYLVLKFMPESLYPASRPHYELKYVLPYMRFGGRRCDVYPASALEGSGLDALLRAIYDERRRADYGYEMALRAYVSQVLLWFIRAWNRARDAAAMDERALVRLQRALDYIDARLDEPLRAADVAEALGMGLSTFSRFFTAAAGNSLPAYVRGRRLGRAAALLAEGGRSVTDVALETGFSSASYLTLCFRRQYGMTPRAFCKLCAGRPSGEAKETVLR